MKESEILPAKGLILIVEDSELIQKILLQMAKSLGFEADIAGNGLEALTVLAEKSYDIIFIDKNMPMLNGFEATKQIRRHEGLNQQTPIILTTVRSASEKDFYKKHLAAGIND